MSLHRYVHNCDALAYELKASLQPADIERLRTTLEGRRTVEWLKWRDQNEKLIAAFVASTQSERKKKKDFQEWKLLLTLAGIQHCIKAHALLSVMHNNFLEPGLSYRGMAASAGVAYQQLFEFEIPYWPFDEVETPFVDDPSRMKNEQGHPSGA